MSAISLIGFVWYEKMGDDDKSKISLGQIQYYDSNMEILDEHNFDGISKDKFMCMYKDYKEYVVEDIGCEFVTWSLK